MGRDIDAVIASLPKARRAKIEANAARKARQMIEYADSIGEIRRAMDKTQSDIARKLGVGQVAVAQMEKRSDLLLSTLRRYVRAAGADLVLMVRTRQGVEIELHNLCEVAGQRKPPARSKRLVAAAAI